MSQESENYCIHEIENQLKSKIFNVLNDFEKDLTFNHMAGVLGEIQHFLYLYNDSNDLIDPNLN